MREATCGGGRQRQYPQIAQSAQIRPAYGGRDNGEIATGRRLRRFPSQ